MNNTNDIIITAIQSIAESLTTQQKYDRTIQVAIYSQANVNEDEVEYDVKYQNTLFRVYAKKGETYKTGDTVYVKIPEKDSAQKIYIEGIVTADSGLPVDKTKIIETGESIEYAQGLKLSSGFYRVSAKFTNNENNKDEYKLNLTDSISFDFQDFTGNPFKFNGTEQIKYITLINETEIISSKDSENFDYTNLTFTPCEIILLNENEAYLAIYTPDGNNLNTTNGTKLEGKYIEKGEVITPDEIQWYKADPTGYSSDVGWGWLEISNATNLIYFAKKAGKYLLFVKKDGIILTKIVEVIDGVKIVNNNGVLSLSSGVEANWTMDQKESPTWTTGKTYSPDKTGTVYCQLRDGTILTYEAFIKSDNGPDYEIQWSGRECFLYNVNGYSVNEFDKKEWTLQPIIFSEFDISKFILTWFAPDGEELVSKKTYSPKNCAFETMWVDSENILHFRVPPSLSWSKNRNGKFKLKVKNVRGAETEFEKEIILIRQGETGTNGNGYVAILRPAPSWRVLAFDTEGFPINLFGSEIKYSEIKDGIIDIAKKSITTIDDNNEVVCLYPMDTDPRFPLYVMYDTNGYNPKYDKAGVIKSFKPDNSIGNKNYQKIEIGGETVAYVLKYHNVYGSEVINDWDGITTTIGDNSILAQQIIAGEKGSNGAFTGLVMGKDSSQDDIGLYGYSKGVNSFGLLADGTAYFGNGKNGIYLDPKDNKIKLGKDVVISWGLTEDDLYNDYGIGKMYYLDPDDSTTVLSSSYLYSPEIEAGVFRVIGVPIDKTTPSGEEVKQFSAYHLCDEDNYSNGALYYRLLGEDTAVASNHAVYLRAGLDFDEDNEYNYTVALKLEATGNVSIGAGTTWASEGGVTQTHDENYFIYCHNKIVGKAWGYGTSEPTGTAQAGQLYFKY